MENLTVKMRIKSTYRDLNPKEKQIADYIIDNIKLVSRSSISDISRSLGVADSTVYQFTKKLGYNGFKDFKVSLLTDEFDSEISIHEKISSHDTSDSMIGKVFVPALKHWKIPNESVTEKPFRMLLHSCLTLNKYGFLV